MWGLGKLWQHVEFQHFAGPHRIGQETWKLWRLPDNFLPNYMLAWVNVCIDKRTNYLAGIEANANILWANLPSPAENVGELAEWRPSGWQLPFDSCHLTAAIFSLVFASCIYRKYIKRSSIQYTLRPVSTRNLRHTHLSIVTSASSSAMYCEVSGHERNWRNLKVHDRRVYLR